MAVALAAMCGRIGTNRSRHDFRGDNKEIRIRKRTMTFLMNVEVRKKKKGKKGNTKRNEMRYNKMEK